jgi:hypothetical protein
MEKSQFTFLIAMKACATVGCTQHLIGGTEYCGQQTPERKQAKQDKQQVDLVV